MKSFCLSFHDTDSKIQTSKFIGVSEEFYKELSIDRCKLREYIMRDIVMRLDWILREIEAAPECKKEMEKTDEI